MNLSTLARPMARPQSRLWFSGLSYCGPQGDEHASRARRGLCGAMIATNLNRTRCLPAHRSVRPVPRAALISFVTVARGVIAVLRRRPGWLLTHYYSMAWSYIGLSAAACAEVIVRSPLLSDVVHNRRNGMLVGLACAAAFMIVGLFLVPRLQARALAYQREG